MLRDRGREIFLFFLFSSFRNLLNLLIRVYISHSAGVTRSNEQVFSAAISKQRNLGDQLPKFEHEHPKGKTGVYFFWDFNTTPLKESCDDVPNLKHNLTSALKEYKQEYTLMEKEIGTGYGDLRNFTPDQFLKLTSEGFKLHHVITRKTTCGNTTSGGGKCGAEVPPPRVPGEGIFCLQYLCLFCKIVYQYSYMFLFLFLSGVAKKDQPDMMLLISMYAYANQHEQKTHMFIISGDPDFATTVATLEDRGHRVFVAVPPRSNIILRKCGTMAWRWKKLQEGKKPIQKNERKK